MRLTDFLVRESISPDIVSQTKEDIIKELVGNLRGVGYFAGDGLKDVVSAVQRRETLGSTGIGGGVAIPHAKHEIVDRLVGTLAISKSGVDYESTDTAPVHVFIMLISPKERTSEHLRALEYVSRCMRGEDVVDSLRRAESVQAIWDLLEKIDRDNS